VSTPAQAKGITSQADKQPTGARQAIGLAAGSDAVRFAEFAAEARKLGVKMLTDEPLARHTTFRIGGPADLYAVIREAVLLERLAGLATEYSVPTLTLGGGSNVLVSDAGVRGLVIANRTREFRLQDSTGVQLVARSGIALAGLARWAIRAGLSGLEWAVSLPGTVGGAVIGNAGAHGGEIAKILAWALVSYTGLGRQTLTVDQLEYSYRSSALKQQPSRGDAKAIVLMAGFRLTHGDVTAMNAQAEVYLAKRRASQPVEPSAGSIFRNPLGDHAARLIDTAGLKGSRIGGALISPQHANFIVNDTGTATASDVVGLIDLVRSRVYDDTGIELKPEIVFVGEWCRQPPYEPLKGLKGGQDATTLGKIRPNSA
jgi:UDP-N-acetylmuramate dehydrogenase